MNQERMEHARAAAYEILADCPVCGRPEKVGHYAGVWRMVRHRKPVRVGRGPMCELAPVPLDVVRAALAEIMRRATLAPPGDETARRAASQAASALRRIDKAGGGSRGGSACAAKETEE